MSSNKWVWIDCEMTGLNPDKDRIVEIATIVTDDSLNIIDIGPNLVIHQSDELLDGMDAWNKKHHGNSGLIQKVKKSQINEQQAAAQTIEFLRQYCKKGASPLCGNSIWQDRRFLSRYMPDLDQFFHYRMIDVSTIKILVRHWKPKLYNESKNNKKNSHVALDDIKESIEELRLYKIHLF